MGSCHPDNGQWLGFKVGTTRNDTLTTACQLVRTGRLAVFAGIYATAKRCATWRADSDEWYLHSNALLFDRSCFTVLDPEHVTLRFEDGRLSEIETWCSVFDP